MAAETVVFYTLVFLFYSFLEITGSMPQEIQSSGLTLTKLLSRYYGDEDLNFIEYHMKRTTGAIIIHCSLPLIYVLGLQIAYPYFNMLLFWEAPSTIQRLLIVSLISAGVGVLVGVVCSRRKWANHPLAKVLGKYGDNWRLVASMINNEYRGIDKFIADVGRYKVVVTDSWIIKCNPHSVQVARQSESHLKVCSTDEQRGGGDQSRPTQYLTIQVTSTEPHCASFKIRLRSEDYSNLRDRLTQPVQVAREIVIQQTLSDQFLSAFTEQVSLNGIYQIPHNTPALEPCLGCSQTMPQVKLHKTCMTTGESSCQSCHCRPMWCLSCMSKWYASRQDQIHPDTWMAGGATCPLCRQKFCMLDVLKIEQ